MQQASSSSAAAEESLWVEVLDALPINSALHEPAFAQLQGSAQPFQVAIDILAALPQGLRQRSQQILRTWATRETAREAASLAARQEKKAKLAAELEEKEAKLTAKRLERIAQIEADQEEKQEQRDHELALLRLGKLKRSPATKRTQSNASTPAKRRNVAVRFVAQTNETDGDAKAPSMYMVFKSQMIDKNPNMSPSLIKSKWKSMGKKERDSYKPGGIATAPPVAEVKVKCKHSSTCERNGHGRTKGFCHGHGGRWKCTHASGCDKQAKLNKLCVSHVRQEYELEVEQARLKQSQQSVGARKRGRPLKTKTVLVNGETPPTMYIIYKSHMMHTNPEIVLRDIKAKWSAMNKVEREVYKPGGAAAKNVEAMNKETDEGVSLEEKCKHRSGCRRSGKNNTKGYCTEHGGRLKCKHQSGCERPGHRNERCYSHGGGKKQCEFQGGCDRISVTRGMCFGHGGGTKCKFGKGCGKQAAKKGLCVEHGRRSDL